MERLLTDEEKGKKGMFTIEAFKQYKEERKVMDLLGLCKCQECPLNGSKKVLGEGTGTDEHYDIILVGIAPAKTEVREGRPLVGWSGTLLRKTLAKLKVTNFYLTNTLLCQLPEDIKEKDLKLATDCCRPRLLEEVKSKSPKIVIAMGNIPLEVLTNVAYKIRSVNGRILPGLVCPVLPVIHPASLSRRADEFYDFVDGLKSAPKYLNNTYQLASIPHRTIVNEDNFSEVLQKLDKFELLAVDLETTGRGFYPYGKDPDKIRCICLATDEKTAYIFPGESSPYFEQHQNYVYDSRLKDLLSRKKCIFHNGPFDVGFLKQAGYDVKIFFDTLLAHYMIDERQYSHGLKALAGKYLGAPNWEEDIKEFLPHKASSYDLVPDDKLYEYAAYDVAYTYQLSEGAGFRRKVANTQPYKEILNPCANMFAEIRHRGIPVDVGYLMELDGVLEKEMDEKLEELEKLVGYSLNPFSSSEVAELLYDSLGYQQIPGFGRSTAARILRILGGEICDKIQEVREFGKLKSTYVVGVANFIDESFRIHPFYNLSGTVTGRISMTDPSMMNVSYSGGVRKLYLPEKGHLILEADQKQMELRCYAITSGDNHLQDLLTRNEDPHQLVQNELVKRTSLSSKWSGHEGRVKAKAGVFGRLYGRGKKDFMMSYKLSEEDADELVAIIDTIFPSVKEYLARVKKEVHETGILTSYFGRKRRFGLVLDENKHECYRQGANFYIQSMASDLNLCGMLHLWDMKDKWGIYPLFPVHDSIVIDIPNISVVPEIKKELERYSKELVNGKIGFKVDCSVGTSWGSTKKLEIN